MKVKMLVAMAGAHFSLSPGDVHECSEDEAKRLIAEGYAEAAPKGARATPVPPAIETAVEPALTTPENESAAETAVQAPPSENA